MKIIFQAGLMLRHGQRTLELVRQLDEDNFQFEDTLTRHPLVQDRHTVLKKIWDKTYQLVLPQGLAISSASTSQSHAPTVELDLSSLDRRTIQEIERRLAYVDGLQKAHVSRGQRGRVDGVVKAVAKRISDPKPPSASSVMEWSRKYQLGHSSPLTLLNGNRFRRRGRRIDAVVEDLIQDAIKTVYLTTKRHTLQHTLDRIRANAKKLVGDGKLAPAKANVSMATLCRRVAEIDLYRRIAAREGIARARYVCRTAMNTEQALYPLAKVEVDHTVLNWVVICDRTGLPLGRPLLTVAIDAFSGYILGFYLSFYGPGVTSVSGVLRNAITPKADFTAGVELTRPWIASGIPDLLVLDNGLEFHARSFKLMAWQLGMNLMHCRVRTPWLKPRVERFFGTLNFLTLDRGRVYKRVPNVLHIDPKKDAAILFSNLVKGLIMFAADVHPLQINDRTLARPIDLMEEGLANCPPVAYPGDMASLRLASALSKELTCSPGGVELLGIPFGGPELLPLRKEHGERFKALVKWDPDDINAIWIQDPTSKVWIESPSRWPHYTSGLSWNQHQLIRKFAREELKAKGAYEELAAARLRLHDFWMDTTSKKSTADTKLAARFGGASSARVMGGNAEAPVPIGQTPIADSEMESPTPREIPSFDAFVMG